MTTHHWIAIGTDVVMATAKNRLPREQDRVYEIRQILSVALFEHVQIHQRRTAPPRDADRDVEPIQLVLR